MKGQEDMPARAMERVMEERVRAAFGAAAETVTARDLPGLPTPPGRSRVTRRLMEWAPRARVHAVVPAIVAACVAMIVVTATLVVPRVLAARRMAGQLPAWWARPGSSPGSRESRRITR